MASRRPPSQRDPDYALHRLAGMFSQVLPGARVRNAAPVKAAGAGRVVAAAAGLLGYAEVSIPYGTLALGNNIPSGPPSIDFSTGDPDLAVSGTDLTYADSGAAAVYATTATWDVSASISGSSDVAQAEFYDPVIGTCSHVFVTTQGYAAVTGVSRITAALSTTSHLRMTTTSTTYTPTYSLAFGTVQLYIARLAKI